MNPMRMFAAVAVLIAGVLALPATAQAQVRQCQVTASSPPAVATYDPFNPSQLSLSNVAISFVRTNGPGGAKPQVLDFYIKSTNPGANGIQLIPVSLIGTGSGGPFGSNIFYPTTGPFPNITVPLPSSPIAGVFRYNFSGNNAASDTFTVNFNITLPPNLNLTASSNLIFDIEYGCDGTGGGPPFSERNAAPNAFTLQVRVLSGLQASYSGPALDFGEVGNLTDPQGQALTRSGNIRVASSGPYTIDMVSAKGYRMSYPAGAPGTEVQNLRYQATFLGATRDPTNTATITKTCVTAGLGSPPLSGGVLHPISVQLLEGGLDEVPSANYSDELTLTFTPLVALTPGNACP